MDEKIHSIALADGTVIDGLKLNGNNFISTKEIAAEMFAGNCSPVIIDNEVHENMELVQITVVAGECWFVLRDLTAEELSQIKMQSDIEYVAMMAGIVL